MQPTRSADCGQLESLSSRRRTACRLPPALLSYMVLPAVFFSRIVPVFRFCESAPGPNRSECLLLVHLVHGSLAMSPRMQVTIIIRSIHRLIMTADRTSTFDPRWTKSRHEEMQLVL